MVAEALLDYADTGEPGLRATPRAWHDPLVISNSFFALAALQWWRRGYHRQSLLLLGCGVASWIYHSSGEDQGHWCVFTHFGHLGHISDPF